MTMSDRIVVMNAGQIEQVATPEDLYRRPASVFVADFIGRANFLEATAGAVADGRSRCPATRRSVRVTRSPWWCDLSPCG